MATVNVSQRMEHKGDASRNRLYMTQRRIPNRNIPGARLATKTAKPNKKKIEGTIGTDIMLQEGVYSSSFLPFFFLPPPPDAKPLELGCF